MPTRAAVQAALLLTDGIHNSPPGSSPLEALADLQEGGVRVYALGVGSPSAVDMTPLNALATGTGGRSYAVGDNQPSLIETKMVEINAEVRGGIITTQPVLFPDSRPSGIDNVIGKPERPVPPRRRPSLERLLTALNIPNIERLYARRGRSPLNRAVAIPIDVEPGADRASFTVTHPEAVDVWLYLLDPSGTVVDTSPGASATQVASSAPHEFIVVERPDPGRWTLVAVRVRSGPSFTAHFVAGGENRNLQVFADAPAVNAKGAPVPISSTARWGHELTNLHVGAVVTAPSGARQALLLDDALPDGGGSGQYVGIYKSTETGRHEALVTVKGSPAAGLADPYRQLVHAEVDSIDTALDVPRFVRQTVVVFEVGESREIEPQPERPHGRVGRPRPVPLVSVRRRRRPRP